MAMPHHTKEEVEAMRGGMVRRVKQRLAPLRATYGALVCADPACKICNPNDIIVEGGLRRKVVRCRNCRAAMESHEVIAREVLQVHTCGDACAASPLLSVEGEAAGASDTDVVKRCGCTIHFRPYAFCDVCFQWAKDPGGDPPHCRGIAAARRMLIDTPGVRSDLSYRQADSNRVCAVCTEVANKVCRCKSVRYCSETCQRAHWKEHKAQCKR